MDSDKETVISTGCMTDRMHMEASAAPTPQSSALDEAPMVKLTVDEFSAVVQTLAQFPYGQVVRAMGALMQARQRAEGGAR